jgi:hypothetical protein
MPHHPKSERAIKTIARTNYIHGQHQKISKIPQDDPLYTKRFHYGAYHIDVSDEQMEI